MLTGIDICRFNYDVAMYAMSVNYSNEINVPTRTIIKVKAWMNRISVLIFIKPSNGMNTS